MMGFTKNLICPARVEGAIESAEGSCGIFSTKANRAFHLTDLDQLHEKDRDIALAWFVTSAIVSHKI